MYKKHLESKQPAFIILQSFKVPFYRKLDGKANSSVQITKLAHITTSADQFFFFFAYLFKGKSINLLEKEVFPSDVWKNNDHQADCDLPVASEIESCYMFRIHRNHQNVSAMLHTM